jgi:hypothetical protein
VADLLVEKEVVGERVAVEEGDPPVGERLEEADLVMAGEGVPEEVPQALGQLEMVGVGEWEGEFVRLLVTEGESELERVALGVPLVDAEFVALGVPLVVVEREVVVS